MHGAELTLSQEFEYLTLRRTAGPTAGVQRVSGGVVADDDVGPDKSGSADNGRTRDARTEE